MRLHRGLPVLGLVLALHLPRTPVAAAGAQVQVDNSTGNEIAQGAVLRGDPGSALVTVTNGYHFWAAIDRLTPVGHANLQPAALTVDLGGLYAALGLVGPSATAAYTGTFAPGGTEGVRVHYDFTSVGGGEAIAANLITVIADAVGAQLAASSPTAVATALQLVTSLPGYVSFVQAMQQPTAPSIWGLVSAIETMLGSVTGRAVLIEALAEFGVTVTDAALQAAASVVGVIDMAQTLIDLLSASWNGHTDGYDTFWLAVPKTSPTASPTEKPTRSPQPPTAPAAVRLTWVGEGDCHPPQTFPPVYCDIPFTLTWARVPGATHFLVYRTKVVFNCSSRRWTTSGPPSLVGKVGAVTIWSSKARLAQQDALLSVAAENAAGTSKATGADWPVEGPWGACSGVTP